MKKQSIIVLCGFVILAVAATTLVGLLTCNLICNKRSGPAVWLKNMLMRLNFILNRWQ